MMLGMNKIKLVLVSGHARVGKDTFFDILKQIGIEEGKDVFRGFSFAKELKNDLAPLVKEMGIDVHTPTNEQKELIRNLMIHYGCTWRAVDINHWVKKVDAQIDKLNPDEIAVIRDVRFISEAKYYFEKYGRENVFLLTISRYGSPTPPKEELENQPALTENSDIILQWETDPTFQSLKPKVQYVYDNFFLGIN